MKLIGLIILASACAAAPAELPELECNMRDGGAISDMGGWYLVSCNRMPEPGELANPASVCEAHGPYYFCSWFFQ